MIFNNQTQINKMFLYNINLQITNINCQSQMRSQSNGPSDYKNQFLSNEANSFIEKDHEKQNASEYQKMFLMFQKMASDPNMFMKMMASSLNMRQAEPEQRKRQFQIQQHKYRNHEVSPRRNAQSPFAQKQSRKKGTDLLKRPSTQENDFVLEKYYQAPKQQNQKVQTLADSSITISSRQQHISPLEDRPIQSAYAMQNQNRPTIKGANPIKQQIPKYNDDQRPIKSAKGYNYQVQANQSVLMNNSGIHAPVDESKYRQAQQRPIKGIQGDFKAYVMKKQGLPISQHQQKQDQQNNQQQNQNAEPPKVRQFLKRGSRQHLSSAKDKSVVKQKNNTKNNQKQQLDKSINGNNLKDTNQNGERSISQNRILGRKSISSKSISKKPQQKLKTQQQKRTLQYSNTTSNYNTVNQGNRSPRIRHNDVKKKRQNSNSPTFQVQTSARPPKEPKKNIFQQSSSQQQTQPKNSRVNQFSNKTQVIAGVFLTKKQLHQILTKHSKNTPSTSNSSEVEIQQLKAKYIDLCNILAQQKNLFEAQMQKQKEEFQQYKQSEIQKIKNQRKVQQRNLMNTQKNKQREKQKQDLQNLKKTLQKQREQFRHKEKNYKIMVQKYKKLAQQKQKPNNNIQQIKVQQNNSTANKKKIKNNLRPDSISYTESQQALTNSFKGAQQNIGFNINKKQNSNSIKDTSFTKDNKDRLPNYQDLKKPNINQIKPPNNQQPTETKNKKYEYYQQLQNKKTKIAQKTTNQYYNQQQDRQQQYRSDQQDKQQIVQYNPSMKLSDLTKITLNIKMVTEDMIDNLFRYDNNPQYRKYIQITSKPRTKIHTSRNAADRKVTNVYADGGKQVIFDTGVKKQYFNNGYVIIFFANGDIKQKLTDQTVLYFYKQKQVDQITLPNKMNIYRFQNNQVQFHFEDKTVQIRHPDGTFKIV